MIKIACRIQTIFFFKEIILKRIKNKENKKVESKVRANNSRTNPNFTND
jgi:hypothetical protein